LCPRTYTVKKTAVLQRHAPNRQNR